MHAESSSSFTPLMMMGNGHVQTLAAYFLPKLKSPAGTRRHVVKVERGDEVVIHDDQPEGWAPGSRAAVLIHGLAGSFESAYMVRIARKLLARGIRTFRMDLRGCGAGMGLASHSYHSGLSCDAAGVVAEVARICPGSPITLAGFSLGANITLKLMGEIGAGGPAELDSAVAVCPPIDLSLCVNNMQRGVNRFYDRFFASELVKDIKRQSLAPGRRPGPASVEVLHRPPRSVREFDDRYTAAVWGFQDAADYYRQSSSGPFVSHIRRRTMILTAQDDPLIPYVTFKELTYPGCVELVAPAKGGHLGFLASGKGDPDRHWMDWRVVEWIKNQGEIVT